jgi:hypothetical protein
MGAFQPSAMSTAFFSMLLGRGLFEAAVGMSRKAALLAGVYGRIRRPWPSAKLRASIVGEGVFQLRSRVHDERAVLCDQLDDRPALKKQNLHGTIDAQGRYPASPTGLVVRTGTALV